MSSNLRELCARDDAERTRQEAARDVARLRQQLVALHPVGTRGTSGESARSDSDHGDIIDPAMPRIASFFAVASVAVLASPDTNPVPEAAVLTVPVQTPEEAAPGASAAASALDAALLPSVVGLSVLHFPAASAATVLPPAAAAAAFPRPEVVEPATAPAASFALITGAAETALTQEVTTFSFSEILAHGYASAVASAASTGPKHCLNCNRLCAAERRCGRCRVTFYCNGVCQKQHWPVHKQYCKGLAQAYAASQT